MSTRFAALSLIVCLGCGPVVSPEQAAVRQWLRENTPSGKWEEIRWSDPIEHKGDRFIRLKYRTQNPLGGMTVLDSAFNVTDPKLPQEDNLALLLWNDE